MRMSCAERDGRSPSWGAWIEIPPLPHLHTFAPVAPPRGERGLKYKFFAAKAVPYGRSPSWGAWIEIMLLNVAFSKSMVAPPRGERGLKFLSFRLEL